MVGKKQLKLIKSLHQKKYRNIHRLFFVEGIKTVTELLNSTLKEHQVVATAAKATEMDYEGLQLVSETDFKQISALHTPNGVLGVFEMPDAQPMSHDGWILALDAVQDPGNLGTIIRLCDWFGIQNLVCSHGTVDCYNPKTLQATMGSIARVGITYTDLNHFLEKQKLPVYGAFMDGTTIYEQVLPSKGILVLGNEANGIRTAITNQIATKVAIPQFGKAQTESLNVATAAAILLSEVRRPSNKTP